MLYNTLKNLVAKYLASDQTFLKFQNPAASTKNSSLPTAFTYSSCYTTHEFITETISLDMYMWLISW